MSEFDSNPDIEELRHSVWREMAEYVMAEVNEAQQTQLLTSLRGSMATYVDEANSFFGYALAVSPVEVGGDGLVCQAVYYKVNRDTSELVEEPAVVGFSSDAMAGDGLQESRPLDGYDYQMIERLIRMARERSMDTEAHPLDQPIKLALTEERLGELAVMFPGTIPERDRELTAIVAKLSKLFESQEEIFSDYNGRQVRAMKVDMPKGGSVTFVAFDEYDNAALYDPDAAMYWVQILPNDVSVEEGIFYIRKRVDLDAGAGEGSDELDQEQAALVNYMLSEGKALTGEELKKADAVASRQFEAFFEKYENYENDFEGDDLSDGSTTWL
jgi:hypothetical protein